MNIFSGIEYEVLRDVDLNRKYDGIEYDSRKVKENYIFVALEGANVDGHDYIDSAVKNGATCIIVSRRVEMKHKVSYVLIDEIRHKLGYIASNFYEWPQRKLKIIGVTGTNGKTSSTYMIEKLMGDTPITRIGTIEYKIGDEVFEAVNTTPESLDLIKIFDKTLKKKIEYVVMEVSSHSLEIGRVDVLDKKGIVKAIDTVVNEFIECEKEKTDIVDTAIVKVDDDTLKDILKDEGILESFEFVRENQDKLKEIIKNMKVVEFNGRKIEDSNDNENKVKIEIPDEVLNMKSETVLSIRGNREYYKKFKMFVASLGIPLVDFTNYLFYFAMNKMTK